MNDRLEYYDPLYESIVFERGLPPGRGFQLAPADGPLDPRKIVQAVEFTRLAFLRQAGLAWLIFPSATHTRFAHSIGCWWLGRLAESLIKVYLETQGSSADRPAPTLDGQRHSGDWERHSLRWWLEFRDLREEFYLSLLLHDLGHGPLSHVLEHNQDFVRCLRDSGMQQVSHEARGAALLVGGCTFVERWERTAKERYGEAVTRLRHVREELDRAKDGVCIAAVCYLMTGDETYRAKCAHKHRVSLPIVKELISGLLDLDRLDHYARDSYFSGLHQVALNVQGFLANVRIRFPMKQEAGSGRLEPSPSGEDAYLTVTEAGASQAASLLFSKRQIVATMFRNVRAVALHAMANRALSLLLTAVPLDQRTALAEQVAMMDDDELLQALTRSNSDECRYLAQRIRGADPYACVGKWSNVVVNANKPRLEKVALEIARREGILLYADPGFWRRGTASPTRDWLDTGAIIVDETGRPLTEHPEQRADFAHLREAGQVQYLWAFHQDEGGVPHALRDALRGED